MCLRGMFTSVLVLEFVFITFRGRFQQCTSEIVNHLQPDRKLSFKFQTGTVENLYAPSLTYLQIKDIVPCDIM